LGLIVSTPIESSAAERTYVIGYNDQSSFHLLAIDRLRLVYSRAGLKVKFRALPSKRSLISANSRSIDGDAAHVPSVVNTYTNCRRIDVILLDLRGIAYTVRKDIKKYDDSILGKYSIGRVRGVRWSEIKLEPYSSVDVKDYQHLFKMLAINRLNLVFATETSGDPILRKMGKTSSNIIKLQPPVFTTEMHHYVHKKSHQSFRTWKPHLGPFIKRAFGQIK
jgi:hypothetical protein